MITILLSCVFLQAAEAPKMTNEQKSWLVWKQQHYKEALTSPTSFLNAYALEQAEKGESLYLVLDKSRRRTGWQKKAPKKFYLRAEHTGDKIRVQKLEQTLGYLNNRAGERRKKIDLPNGAIAEVVYGRRVGKLWTYLYDPDQIKSFTGFRFYEFNPEAITQGVFKSQKPRFVSYKTVQGTPTQVNHVGNISFRIMGKDLYLPAYNWQPSGQALNYLAMVFTDRAAGQETYAGGRELVIEFSKPPQDGDQFTIDFNRTMNFYCAHSPFWHCPVGLQKKINVNLQAGEMLPLKKVVN